LGIGNWSFPPTDLVFLPNLNFLPPLPKHTRLVVTVHDLSFEHFPDCFTWKQRLWHRAIRPRALLARADAIIAVSKTTKRDLMETYGIPDSRIHVVYPGIEVDGGRWTVDDGRDQKLSTINCQLSTPYILSLSELSPRKNLDGLITAFGQLSTVHSPLSTLHLVIAGNHGSAERALRRQIARSPVRDHIHLIGPVTEDEKHALLARAACFVYPSLWEGFGFPPLEACERGVPVVASTGGALPEVLGDAALLVDPLDPAAIAEGIARVLTDDTLRIDFITRGRARAARYRWEEAAERTHALLASLT
jgi:glycosyltransferase involved in cell wall biosynthesis